MESYLSKTAIRTCYHFIAQELAIWSLAFPSSIPRAQFNRGPGGGRSSADAPSLINLLVLFLKILCCENRRSLPEEIEIRATSEGGLLNRLVFHEPDASSQELAPHVCWVGGAAWGRGVVEKETLNT